MARMNDRGQMLLIGALVMAATFISLGVVLNGSLHTPSIAAEASDDVSNDEFAGVRDTIQREVAGLMEKARTKHTGDAVLQETYVRRNVSTLGEHLGVYYARQDQVQEFRNIQIERGVEVSGSFDGSGGTISETTGAAEFRKFNVVPPSSNSFTIVFDGPQEYEVELDDNALQVRNTDTGTNLGTCDYLGARRPKIELMNATADGEPCQALEFVSDLDGDYSLTINDPGDSGGNYKYLTSDTLAIGDVTEPLVYEVRIGFVYHSTSVDYQGIIDIAPGEP